MYICPYMKFHNPEILYALLLLSIPFIVHLFKFRRFKKVWFPNVSFLFLIERESRRSRKLKKYLVLFLRTMAFLFVILAFAKPYFPSKINASSDLHIVFDASPSVLYSEENKTIRQELLSALQSVLTDEKTYYFHDRNETYFFTGREIVEHLQKSPVSPYVFNHSEYLNDLSKQDSIPKTVYYFTDSQFLTNRDLDLIRRDSLSEYHFFIQKPDFPSNAYVDTLFMTGKDLYSIGLDVVVKSKGRSFKLAVELVVKGKTLFKKDLEVTGDFSDTIHFEIPKKYGVHFGEVRLKGEQKAGFDNVLYFVLPRPLSYRVLIAGKEIPSYLKSLFAEDFVQAEMYKPEKIPWERINEFDLTVFYGWEPYYNWNLIQKYAQTKPVVFIPDFTENDGFFYERFFTNEPALDTIKRNVDHINYSSRFFQDVFQKKERQFHAPFSRKYYRMIPNGEVLLSMTGGVPFFVRKGNVYFFTSALHLPESNFYLSPLIVPAFYKPLMKKQNLSSLYNYFPAHGFVDLDIPIMEKPIKIQNQKHSFIPYMERKDGKTRVFLENHLTEPGIYFVLSDQDTVDILAFNYDRRESQLDYASNLHSTGRIHVIHSKSELESDQEKSPNKLQRILFLLALLFVLLEMIVLRYVKWD